MRRFSCFLGLVFVAGCGGSDSSASNADLFGPVPGGAGSGGSPSGGAAGHAGTSWGTSGNGGTSLAGHAGSGGTSPSGGAAGTTAGGQGGASGSSGSAAGGSAGASGGGAGGSAGGGTCAAGKIVCDGFTAKVCDGNGGYSSMMACANGCAPNLGCVACQPNTGSCNGSVGMVCKPDGSGYFTSNCDPDLGLTCMNGNCQGPCSVGSLGSSYIGCEYYPTVLSNSQLNQSFSFAIAVANASSSDAHVKIYRGTMLVDMTTVTANSLQQIKLPWVPELKNDLTQGQDSSSLQSILLAKGAYHVKSDQPVTVYQFNPLEYQLPISGTCPDIQGTGQCNSFTNDASLLLPVNALGSTYVGASHPTLYVAPAGGNPQGLPGLLTITGTQDGTTLMVRSSANVRAGSGVQAMSPGAMQTFKLDAGDVLQLLSAMPGQGDLSACTSYPLNGAQLCSVPSTYDLTGTSIVADKPIAVFGGHDCDFVPYSQFACDHLEEELFPVDTWGTSVLVTPPQSVLGAASNDGNPDQHIVRVISGANNNQITLDPLPPGAQAGTLQAGQFADVPATNQDFEVKATGPILVVQYMLGGDVVDPQDQGSPNSKGDPSISLAIPSEQYRSDYVFLAPETYEYNFVNIIAPTGAHIMLDGQAVTTPAAKPIGASGFSVTRKGIAGGSHHITGDQSFGIVVYGYGAYTSYMYPGGLNLTKL